MQMRQTQSTQIFIQDVTLLDCAIMLPNRVPKGQSWYVDIIWEGEKDETGVLFDFSLAKKSAKSTIDHEFDHKLLVKPTDIRFQSHSQTIVIGSCKSNESDSYFAINTFNNSVKKVTRETITALNENNFKLLENEIANAILKNSPKNVKKVSVTLREHNQHKLPHYFHYTHSLCHHYGNCQRFHGHSNIVEIFENKNFSLDKSAQIANKLNNSYIISKNYISKNWSSLLIQELLDNCPEIIESQDMFYAAQYKGTQGKVAIILPKSSTLLLDCESTVENLAEYIHGQFDSHISIEVRAYEGLSKGSICI